MKWSLLAVFLVAGVSYAEIEVPSNLNDLNSMDLDDLKVVKERCEKKGKADSYTRLKNAIKETRTCITNQNLGELENELEEAKKTGSMDEVFARYCKKRPEIKECVLKTVNVAKECLEENEKAAINTAETVIDEVLDFACFRDGDRLAMFVAEGGVECIKTRAAQIRDCFNETLKIDISSLSLTSLPSNTPSLEIDSKKCSDMAKIQECVVNDLEKHCKDTTPANIIDALFKFVKKTVCKNIKQKRSVNIFRIKRSIDTQLKSMFETSNVKKNLEEECEKNGGKNAFNDFLTTLNETKQCLERSRFLITPKEQYLIQLKNCTKSFIPVMESCLPEKAKYYPLFFIQLIGSFMEFAYNHLHLFKETNSNGITYCLQILKHEGINKKIASCLSNENFPQNSFQLFTVPTKAEICQKLSDLDDCLEKFVKQSCPPDIMIDKFLNQFNAATKKPCEDDTYFAQ